MKIAIIRRKFNSFGGAEQFIARTIQGLSAFNVTSTIIAQSWAKIDGASNQNWIKADVQGNSRAAKFLSFNHSVASILSTNQFDLIHF